MRKVKRKREKKEKKKTKKKKKIVKKKMDVTVVKDSKRFVENVIEARGLNKEKVKVRVVIDAGQGSLKVAASVFDDESDPDKKEGERGSGQEKMTGVNRLLILAEVDEGTTTSGNFY